MSTELKHLQSTTKAKAPSPSTINPLIAYEDQPDETAENVRNVLTFMAFAFRDGLDLGSNINASDGAGLIQRCREQGALGLKRCGAFQYRANDGTEAVQAFDALFGAIVEG